MVRGLFIALRFTDARAVRPCHAIVGQFFFAQEGGFRIREAVEAMDGDHADDFADGGMDCFCHIMIPFHA